MEKNVHAVRELVVGQGADGKHSAPAEFTRISLLDAARCRQVRDALYARRDACIQRAPDLPFFTFGAASYLDAQQDLAAYHALARRTAPLLAAEFGWLHELLAQTLSSHLGQPADCAHGFALPGFHVFLAHPAFEQPIGSVHWDAQHLLLDWPPPPRTDFGRPVSFTLAIALPKAGAGLNYWEFEWGEDVAIPPDAVRELVGRMPMHFLEYRVGELVIHSGRLVHQIAPGKDLQPDDERITLQGHALFSDGRWKLYW